MPEPNHEPTASSDAESDPEPRGILLMGIGASPRSEAACVALLQGLRGRIDALQVWILPPVDQDLPRYEGLLTDALAVPVPLAPPGYPPTAGAIHLLPPAPLDAVAQEMADRFGPRCALVLLPDAEGGAEGLRAVLGGEGLALVDPAGEAIERLTEQIARWVEGLDPRSADRPALRRQLDHLNQTHRELRSLMAATGVASLRWSRSLALRDFTPDAKRRLGLTPGDLGQPIEALGARLHHPTLRADAQQVLTSGEPLQREVRSQGGQRWYSLRLAPHWTDGTHLDGVVLTLTDITAARQTRQRLTSRAHKQQIISALWRLALQHSELGRSLLNEVGQALAKGVGADRSVILQALDDPERLSVIGSFGPGVIRPPSTLPADLPNLANQALVEQRLLALAPGEAGPSVEAMGASVEDARIAVPIPGPVAPWGVLCAFSTDNSQLTEETEFLLTVANVLADTAERASVHAQLASQARRFELALRNSTTTVFEHDENLQLRWIYNPPSGRPAEDVLGKTNADIYEGEDVPRLMEMERRVLTTGKGARDSFTMSIGARTIHLDVTMDPLLDPSGQPIGVLGAAAEVTHQKEIERELRELNRTLENRVEQRAGQVRKLATALTLAEQRERLRIAQVLHDHVQQLLYAVQLRLKLLSPSVSAEERAPIDEALGQALHAIRSMSVELSPPVLKDEGLPEALRWLVLQTQMVHGLQVDLDAELPDIRLQRDVGMLLFHFVRELLFNVIKHAQTEHARVRLFVEGEQVVLTVSDDGEGFDPAEVASHSGFGLYGIRERLALFDGHLQIESTPSEGTEIAMRIPLVRVRAG